MATPISHKFLSMKNRAIPVTLLVVTFATGPASAATPELKHLSPAGGQRGTTVEVTFGGKLDKADRLWCSCDGVSAEPTEDGKKIRITIDSEAAFGLCWLRAYNDDGASALRPFIVGALPEVAESEPNDALGSAQQLKSSQTVVNGVLSKTGEVDTFALTLKSGETLVASMTANRVLGSPMDGVLQLLSPDGFVLDQNDDNPGFDPQLVFEVPADGTYFVRTFAFPATPNSSIRFAGGADYVYRLTLTTGPFADHAWPLALTRGQSGTVKVRGWNLGDELQEVPVPDIPDGEPTTVAHPALCNTAAVLATPHPSVVETASGTDNAPQTVEIPTTISGCIAEPGEADVFRFQASKGQKLVLSAAARALNSPLDAVLTLIGPDGKPVKENDDADRSQRDPELKLTAPADGAYRVQVRDLHGRGGFRFVYRLDVALETPGFSLQSDKDAFRATPEKSLEIPVKVTRTNGFEGEVEVSIVGLPEGVEIAPVKSQGKGGTEKAVKLSLTAPPHVKWSGPIRIVGRTEHGEQWARAAISGLEATTRDLWLTLSGGEPPKENVQEDEKPGS